MAVPRLAPSTCSIADDSFFFRAAGASICSAFDRAAIPGGLAASRRPHRRPARPSWLPPAGRARSCTASGEAEAGLTEQPAGGRGALLAARRRRRISCRRISCLGAKEGLGYV